VPGPGTYPVAFCIN